MVISSPGIVHVSQTKASAFLVLSRPGLLVCNTSPIPPAPAPAAITCSPPSFSCPGGGVTLVRQQLGVRTTALARSHTPFSNLLPAPAPSHVPAPARTSPPAPASLFPLILLLLLLYWLAAIFVYH